MPLQSIELWAEDFQAKISARPKCAPTRARSSWRSARPRNARVRKVFLVVFVSRRIMFAVKTRQVEFPKILANF